MIDGKPDRRAWRCLDCGIVVTHDSPAARQIETMASPDIGEGMCPGHRQKSLWRRTNVDATRYRR